MKFAEWLFSIVYSPVACVIYSIAFLVLAAFAIKYYRIYVIHYSDNRPDEKDMSLLTAGVLFPGVAIMFISLAFASMIIANIGLVYGGIGLFSLFIVGIRQKIIQKRKVVLSD